MHIVALFPLLICAVSASALAIASRSTPTSVQTYKSWSQVSDCFQDNNGYNYYEFINTAGRALHHLQERSDHVSVNTCLDACEAGGFILGGVEYGTECWCGNSIMYDNHPQSADKCGQACGGNPTQMCGGPNALNLYARAPYTSTAQSFGVVQNYKNYHFFECWQDERYLFGGNRLLPQHPNIAIPHEEMTVERCIDACAASGYNSAGLEWSQECWCGNPTWPIGQSTTEMECNMPCTADAREYCGGPNRLLAYTSAVF